MVQIRQGEGFSSRFSRSPCPVVFRHLDCDFSELAAAQMRERSGSVQRRLKEAAVADRMDRFRVDLHGLALQATGRQ